MFWWCGGGEVVRGEGKGRRGKEGANPNRQLQQGFVSH